MEGYIWTPEGRAVGRLDHIFKGTKNIVESQIVQEQLDEIIIRIVASDGFTEADAQLVLKHARERLGPRMKIRLEFVPKIERTSNGKFVAVVCKIKPPQLQR